MTTAAIIGCGKIAGSHLDAIVRSAGSEVIALVDRDQRQLDAFGERVPGAGRFTDLDAALALGPDVVHVLTPPSTHAPIGLAALAAGANVMVEKPMAESVADVDRMLAAARQADRLVTTVHNYLLKPSVVKARAVVEAGEIGDVVEVVTFYGISGETSTGGTEAGGHWAWRLRGGIFTNFLPHNVYLHHAFMGADVDVTAVHTAGAPEDPFPSELTALLAAGPVTGVLRVSLNTQPYVKFVEVRGTDGIVRADLVRETFVHQRRRDAPGMVDKVLYNASEAAQLAFGTLAVTAKVGLGRMPRMPGLHVQVRDFHEAVAAGRQPLVTGEQGRAVVATMERIWAAAPQLEAAAAAAATGTRRPATPAAERAVAAGLPDPVLVTGAGGYVGGRLVRALADCGVRVRALVRDPARVPFGVERDAEVVVGDLRDRGSLDTAVAGVAAVVHAGAVTTNQVPYSVHEADNVAGTENLLAAAAAAGVGRLVHLSTVVVTGLDRADGSVVAETEPPGVAADELAFYQRSKAAAEQLVLAASGPMEVVVLRPGIVYGPGRPVAGGLVQVGPVVVGVGRGRNHLPFVHVDNVVDGILLALATPGLDHEVFHLVDDGDITVREAVAHKARILPFPSRALFLLAGRAEGAAQGATPPKLSRFVLRSRSRDLHYDTSRARGVLGWEPNVKIHTGLQEDG